MCVCLGAVELGRSPLDRKQGQAYFSCQERHQKDGMKRRRRRKEEKEGEKREEEGGCGGQT